MKKPPQNKIQYEFFEPVKVFFALLIVALFFFAPISSPIENDHTKTLNEYFPALDPFASSADACPFKCVVCTSWDESSWPKNCLTYECNAECEAGDPGGGGGGAQPPSITHVLTCSQNGLNSWCLGALSLDLTASDPQGQAIIISGDVNGTPFACPSGQTTCSIPLPEGTGAVNYKIDSATGLSATGATTYQLDITTPQVNGNIIGTSGANGWYISQISVTASASDTLSGIAAFEMNVASTGSGLGWASYADATFTDGIHSIQYRAYDNAGNITETAQQEIKVDTLAPILNVSVTGATGANGWYVSTVMITPAVSDSGSGLAVLEATTDGVTWSIVNGPLSLSDGIYNVQFRAIDNAGNVTQTVPQEIKVDATTPSLSLNISGTRGQNDWYVSAVSVTPNASDAGSSIHTVEAKINGGSWVPVTSDQSSVFSDGVHTYQYRVTDNAGNVTETPALPVRVDTVPPAIAIYDDTLELGDTLMYDLEDPSTRSGQVSGLWINRLVIEDDAEKYKKIVWVEEITGNKSNNHEIRWDGVFMDGTEAEPGQYFITFKISDRAGNESMRTATVEVTAFNSIVPIPAFAPPVNGIPKPVPGGSAPANEPAFGGETNQTPTDSQTTTITEGGAQATLEGMSLQAGGTTFSAGNNPTASLPITNPNILWGAAASAVLGATLAEWQRRREEEEAARRAAMQNSSSDNDEIPADVLARRRARVIAKNETKREQERRWEAAREAENQKKDEAIEAAWNRDRRAHSLESMSATIASQTAQREQERLNDVSAAWWAGLASVAQGKEESEKKNTGGKVLAMPVREDDPPTWWEKYVVQPWNKYIVQPVKNIWDKFTSLFTKDSTTPTSTPAALPTQTQFPTVVFTPTISVSPTVTPTPIQPNIDKIDGPMTVNQIPLQFKCTLPETAIINGKELYADYYYRCKIGELLAEGIFTDPNGWWWEDGKSKNGTEWFGIKDTNDVWKLMLTLGLDAEGTKLRVRDQMFAENLSLAFRNKFWYFDHFAQPSYERVIDYNAPILGTNGRLTYLGSLEALQTRVDGKDGFVKQIFVDGKMRFVPTGRPISQVIAPPWNDYITNNWESAYKTVNDIIWPEPTLKCPPPGEAFDFANPYYETPQQVIDALKSNLSGNGRDQVLYMNTNGSIDQWVYILSKEQKEYFYGHQICAP